MVLFKRKPVQFLPPVDISDEDTEVWHIPETGEVFVSYEDYLTRMDFYKQRRFNDQITGQSGMTFFEAHKSELHGGKEVEESFPEALKGPILRKVQFQTVSRLDHLVDILFDQFKQDYYPGEEVTITLDAGDRANGLVRDKLSFGPRILPDGTKCRPTTRYMVYIKDSETERSVTDEHICRERGAFTKAMLRSFIKQTTFRDAWNGAPWLVKHEYAGQFHIDSRIPHHLQWANVREERKQAQAQKKASQTQEANGDETRANAGPMRLPDLKPVHKSQKGKPVISLPFHEHQKEATPPPPPPPPKYPIDDLQLAPREDVRRPPIQFMCKGKSSTETTGMASYSDQIEMESVGPLLETWDTLNVYCEIFKLDSFTFDDFLEAMVIASEDKPVQLFHEIHCSVLKILVDSERDGGKVRITLPELDDEDSQDDDQEDEDEEDMSQSNTPEPEIKPTGRATRSSLAKLEAERLAAEAAAAEEEEVRAQLETKHRAEEVLKDFSWIDQLRSRDFSNGGWEMIMVGLLHQLSKNPRKMEECEDLLLQLAPPHVEPSRESVRETYAELDVNYRIKALQIICMLTMETKTVRGFMEECSETMTKYRKEKIEWQRQRKQATEELRQLNEQRKVLLPDNTPQAPTPNETKTEEDAKMADADETIVEDDTEEEADSKSRKRRRKSEKQAESKEKPVKAAKAAKPPAQSREFIKLLKQITEKERFIKECEDEVAVIENDLREADCPRTRCLGKDRFWNRYYWFERNGMPYGGLPTSSTAEAEYANGCIWVQGPDDMEREGYIDMPKEWQDEYKAQFDMTVPERKAQEEGETNVFTAQEWGYISDAESLYALIKWLDTRGINEAKLRKELLLFKDKIVHHMEKRTAYLAPEPELETTMMMTEKEVSTTTTTKRTSNRIREKTPEPTMTTTTKYRCMLWENTMALNDLGHLHSEPAPKPRARKQTKKREAGSDVVSAPAKKSRRG